MPTANDELNSCGSITPTLIFEADGCPSGWTCSGSATVKGEGSLGRILWVGGDNEKGSATSNYFPVPTYAVGMTWDRCGGAEDGGVIVQDVNGNTICDIRDGTDTNTMFQQSCNLIDRGITSGECIRIYVWDNQRYILSVCNCPGTDYIL